MSHYRGPGSRHCDGCGVVVSANKRKCRACIEQEIAERFQQYQAENATLPADVFEPSETGVPITPLEAA